MDKKKLKTVENAWIGWKGMKAVENRRKRFNKVENGFIVWVNKQLITVKNGWKQIKTDGNGWKRLKMVESGWKWMKIDKNGWTGWKQLKTVKTVEKGLIKGWKGLKKDYKSSDNGLKWLKRVENGFKL